MADLSEFTGPPLSEESGIGALTLPGLISELCETYAEREAVYWRNLAGLEQRWTYAQLLETSKRVARSLMALGVNKGTRVGILISNRPEWLFGLFGAAMAGGTVVALNTFSTRQELKHQLQAADISVVLTESEVASHDFIDDFIALCPRLGETATHALESVEFPFLKYVICVDRGAARGEIYDWEEFLAAGDTVVEDLVTARGSAAHATDDALIFFSSGSTALPKAIRQTHRAATLQCWRMAKMYDFDSSVRTWNANGYFFSGNFAMSFGTLCRGGCLVMLRYFDPDKALALIQDEKVSCVIAWPHQEERFKECVAWDGADFSHVKWVTYFSTFREHPTAQIEWAGFDGYGMTETFTFVSLISGSDNADRSQGKVLPGNTIRIVDPESGQLLPVGETGEIIVKGPTLTPGYIGTPPEATFDDAGFLHTADAGYFSSDGQLFWKGRLSDIIKTGGANVSPAEIDSIIAQHPAIQASFTVGVPHDSLGEIVVSCIVLREGRQLSGADVKSHAREYLSGYKVPREVLIFAEEELPLTGSNKVKHSDLRILAAARLAANE